jgi:uncharacterized protein DUF3606
VRRGTSEDQSDLVQLEARNMIGIKRTVRDRGKINLAEPTQVRLWVKGLGASKQEIERAIEKVGNSAAAVRKELGRAISPR